NNSSYTEFLADEATFDPSSVFEEWGFGNYLIDYNEGNNSYFSSASESFANNQGTTDIRTGSQYQTSIAFGANYNNNFYIGASIGIAGFNYRSQRKFDEVGVMKDATEFAAVNQNSDFLNENELAYDFLDADYELSFSSVQKTNGTGINGTL